MLFVIEVLKVIECFNLCVKLNNCGLCFVKSVLFVVIMFLLFLRSCIIMVCVGFKLLINWVIILILGFCVIVLRMLDKILFGKFVFWGLLRLWMMMCFN